MLLLEVITFYREESAAGEGNKIARNETVSFALQWGRCCTRAGSHYGWHTHLMNTPQGGNTPLWAQDLSAMHITRHVVYSRVRTGFLAWVQSHDINFSKGWCFEANILRFQNQLGPETVSDWFKVTQLASVRPASWLPACSHISGGDHFVPMTPQITQTCTKNPGVGDRMCIFQGKALVTLRETLWRSRLRFGGWEFLLGKCLDLSSSLP